MSGALQTGGGTEPGENEVTRLLRAIRNGDTSVEPQLMELVYDELRQIAARLMRDERGEHTLQPTALVHEAYLHLLGPNHPDYQNRAHFFAIAARLMRWILVDYARKHSAEKRGGRSLRLPLDRLLEYSYAHSDDFLAFDEALRALEQTDARAARIMELRFFVGLTVEETARALGVSVATVRRDWLIGRAYISHALKGMREEEPGAGGS